MTEEEKVTCEETGPDLEGKTETSDVKDETVDVDVVNEYTESSNES